MATLTIRNVPENVKQSLRIKAAETGRSLEESLRQLLADEVGDNAVEASRIDAAEILRRADEVAKDRPRDGRFKYFTQKELSDAISGEYEGI